LLRPFLIFLMYLFVYGTLRKTFSPRAASAHSRFLSDAIYCGTAPITGYLYSLGNYPALVFDENSPALVKGEIYQIDEKTLIILDEYEEIDPQNPNNEYQRRQIEIITDQGNTLTVWVYLMNQKRDGKELIPSGDWCEEV
jgi:gamma-glutamylcyclotransferase (GGCT)/AIG2-like uncharacterized protein YtfP